MSQIIRMQKSVREEFGQVWDHIPAVYKNYIVYSLGVFANKSVHPVGTKRKLRLLFDALPELNISKVAARMGIPQSVFAAYLCGAKKPSDTRLKEIEKTLHELGKELSKVSFT